MRTTILCALLFVSKFASSQSNLAQFAVWKPKPGLEANFEAGYKKHLEWHKKAGDT